MSYCGLVDAKISASDKDLPVKAAEVSEAFLNHEEIIQPNLPIEEFSNQEPEIKAAEVPEAFLNQEEIIKPTLPLEGSSNQEETIKPPSPISVPNED